MVEAESLTYLIPTCTLLAAIVTMAFSREERLWLLFGWFAHLGSAFAQGAIYLYYYEGGDLVMYSRKGVEIGAALRHSGADLWQEWAKLLFQLDARLPMEVAGIGASTGTMSALTGLVGYLFGGDVFTSCVAFSFISYLGKVAMYAALATNFGPVKKAHVLAATMFIPSVVFWTSAPLKETVAVAGLGWLLLSMQKLRSGKKLYLLGILFGIVVVGLSKPYILMAWLAGLAAWFYAGQLLTADRSKKLLTRPLALGLSLGLLALGVLGIGEVFEKLSIGNVIESAASQQEASARVAGGSNYTLTDEVDRSLAGQLAILPLALLSVLFRPFIFEVRNPFMLLSAIETTFVLGLVARASFSAPVRGQILERVRSVPWLAFSSLFCFILAVGVGLSTTNAGTLSRYRVPLQPLLFLALLCVSTNDRVREIPVVEANDA